MGKRGPPRMPTEMLAERGSWLADVREGTEPVPERGYPRQPAGFDADCKAEWQQLRAELEPMGIVTLADGSMLERIVWLRVQCRRLRKRLEGKADDGYSYNCGTSRQLLPDVGALNKWHEQLAKLEMQYALTPACRSMVEVPGRKKGGLKIAARTSTG